MSTPKERIGQILERWFLSEPALFQVLCMHELVENKAISCPVRCGRKRVEYNPYLLEGMTDKEIDALLRTEAIRILLKHPYERRPDQCCDQATAIGSNITIGDNYTDGDLQIDRPDDYDLNKGMPYEWYSRRIQEMLPPSEGGNGGNAGGNTVSKFEADAKANSDLSALWEEDAMAVALIDGIIDSVKEWGSLAGAFAEKLKASTKAKINWRNVFSGFRASILSSQRRLTRMRPNRRSGFEQMGSTRQFTTKLLVAVDVSGSISSKALSNFFGVVNSAFRYGFEDIDVVQFDCGVRVVQSLKHVMKDVTILGRGGTSFQEPIDYAIDKGYDGLVILTDGCAPEPYVPQGCHTKILWVCEDQHAYDYHHRWMEKSGRVCTVLLQ